MRVQPLLDMLATRLAMMLVVGALALVARPAAAQNGEFVVIVHPTNPVTRLTSVQLSQIFLGKLQAWDFRGRIEPVLAVDLKPDSRVRATFTQKIHKRPLTAVESYWRQEVYAGRNVPPLEQTEAEALEHVRTRIGGIAYVSASADLAGVKVVRVQ